MSLLSRLVFVLLTRGVITPYAGVNLDFVFIGLTPRGHVFVSYRMDSVSSMSLLSRLVFVLVTRGVITSHAGIKLRSYIL